MAQVRIIGCTTTGAAKYKDLLQNPSIAPSVVLVEEAGEVLEAHTLTCLSPRTESLILVCLYVPIRLLKPILQYLEAILLRMLALSYADWRPHAAPSQGRELPPVGPVRRWTQSQRLSVRKTGHQRLSPCLAHCATSDASRYLGAGEGVHLSLPTGQLVGDFSSAHPGGSVGEATGHLPGPQ